MKFRPDIEGLRALAIVPVVAFHAFPSVLTGGFVGVDVFFVISGYLITSLLMQRLESRQYSIASFYGARIRRIFPALFFMLALVTPVAFWLLPPFDQWEFGRMLAATSLFASNIELYRTTGYFEGSVELKPLVHTWSLAVEEQYYILFPLLLALLFRYARRSIAPVLLLIGAASLATGVWLLPHDPALAFYFSGARAFELMIGSLLAVLPPRVGASRVVRELLALLGLGLLVGACVLFRPTTPFPGWSALIPSIATALIIWSGSQGTTWTNQLVAAPPLRWIGALSYSLYLWHWPVLVLTRHWLLAEPSIALAAIDVLASVLFAWASLHWIEAPVRRARATDRRLLLGGAVCIVVTVAVAWVATRHSWTLQKESGLANTLFAGALDSNPYRKRCHAAPDAVIPYEQRCRFGSQAPLDRSARVGHSTVWADSHGAELALALGERAGIDGYSIAQITASGCPPVAGFEAWSRPQCTTHNQATLDALVKDASLDSVVMIARYNFYLAADAPAFEEALRRSAQVLSAAGKRVILLEPIPTYGYPIPAALGQMHRRGVDPMLHGQSLAEYQSRNHAALEMLSRLGTLPGVTVFSMQGELCQTGRCDIVKGDRPLYFDDNHLSMEGARRVARDLYVALQPAR